MKRKHPLIPTEDDLAKLITDWLSYNRYFWFYVPNKGRFDYGQDKKTLGAPDIVIVVGGLFIAVEFKAPKGRQTPEQKEFQRRLGLPGTDGIYVLARDLEDVTTALQNIGGK